MGEKCHYIQSAKPNIWNQQYFAFLCWKMVLNLLSCLILNGASVSGQEENGGRNSIWSQRELFAVITDSLRHSNVLLTDWFQCKLHSCNCTQNCNHAEGESSIGCCVCSERVVTVVIVIHTRPPGQCQLVKWQVIVCKMKSTQFNELHPFEASL